MSIDFTLPPDVVAIRDRVRRFMDEEVRPVESRLRELADPRAEIQKLRDKAKREKLWNPHLPAEWGGLGLGPMAMATVSAECGRTRWGAYVLNCMKTLKGARATVLKDFAGGKQAFSQAAFKWVLSNPHVSGLVVSIQDFEQIDEYLFASGKSFSDADLALLEDYDRRIAHEYCRPGCGQCLDHCPNDVPVDDVLRYGMPISVCERTRSTTGKRVSEASAIR